MQARLDVLAVAEKEHVLDLAAAALEEFLKQEAGGRGNNVTRST